MYNRKSVLEIETQKLLWNCEIQTDLPISARRADLVLVKKEQSTCRVVGFVVPADHKVKLKKSEKRDKCLDIASKLKNYET